MASTHIARISAGGIANRAIGHSLYGFCKTSGSDISKIVNTYKGSSTAIDSNWVSGDLFNGLTIKVRFQSSNTASGATPTLNVNGTGPKPFFRYGTVPIGNTPETSWYPNEIITITYDTTLVTGGCWIMSEGSSKIKITNTDTFDRVKLSQGPMKAATNLLPNNICVAMSEQGYFPLNSGNSFDITYPIVYTYSSVNIGNNLNNVYIIVAGSISATQTITLIPKKPVYIKGSLRGTVFTPVSEAPLTQDIPDYEDGYQYMYLGHSYSSVGIYLLSDHPIYEYTNGIFGLYSNAPSFEQKNEAFFTRELSGDNIFFDDGANNIPVKSLKINIDPIQNLHGQIEPFCDNGEGKNLCPRLKTEQKNGLTLSRRTSDNRFILNGYPIKTDQTIGDVVFTLPAGTYGFKGGASTSFILRLQNLDTSQIRDLKTSSEQSTFTLLRETNFKISIYIKDKTNVSNLTFSPIIYSSGDGTYEINKNNICPIYQYNEINIINSSKNLIDEVTYTTGKRINENGSLSNDINYQYTDYIPVNSGETYSFYGICQYAGLLRVHQYNNNQQWLRQIYESQSKSKFYLNNKYLESFTISNDAAYIRLSFPIKTNNIIFAIGNKYNFTLPEEDKIYGGILDVNSGKIKVTWTGFSLTGQEDWQVVNYDDIEQYFLNLYEGNGNYFSEDSTKQICTHLPFGYQGDIGFADGFCLLYQSHIDVTKCIMYISSANTLVKHKAYLREQYSKGTPVTIVYALKEPIEYYVGSQKINTFLGQNYIHTNNGNIQLVYRVNTDDEIDSTLSISKKAADAKITGDKIRSLYIEDQVYVGEEEIISFSDGADNVPIKELTVGIAPKLDSNNHLVGINNIEVTHFKQNKNLYNTPIVSYSKDGIMLYVHEDDKTITLNGTATTNTFFSFQDQPLKAGTYILNGCPAGGSVSKYMMRIYKVDNTLIATDYGNGAEFTLNTDTRIILRIQVYRNITINKVFKPMIRLATDEDSTYEPYHQNNKTYNIDFSDKVGTIYSGNLNVTSGELTVDSAIVDMGSFTWRKETQLDNGTYYTSSPQNSKPTCPEGDINALCEAYDLWEVTSYDDVQPDNTFYLNSSETFSYSIIVRDTAVANANELKQKLDGKMLLYTLTDPITYQLDPIEITTFLGENNIQTSIGLVKMIYRADTKLYIDKRINELYSIINNNTSGPQ